ncbi:hypothetical protein ACI703_19170 [Isoptericola jiangsuensis]|uniref:hypothetical protein n=1 Tax=Isoptericola jiangsuensis TaxID=548579 RepID=UPI0038694B0C
MKSSKPLAFTLAGLSIVALAALGVSREMQGKAVSPATGRAPEASALGLKQDKDTSAAGAPMQPRLPAKASPSSPRPGDPLSGAKTEADVAWLQRNGYPSAEAVQDALLRRGTRGPFNQKELQDPAAILDAEQLALLDPSRRSEALDFLAASAQSGSIYALETLARIYDEGANGISDPVRGSAYRKAAEIRGSWPAGLVNGRSQLTPQQDMYATLMAHQVISNIDRNRLASGLPALGVDTRPGLDELITEIGKGGSASTL